MDRSASAVVESRTLQPKCTIKDCGGEVLACRFSGDGSSFALASSDGTVQTFATKTPQTRVASMKATEDKMPATSLRFLSSPASPDERSLLFAAYASGVVRVWHTSTKTCLRTVSVSKNALTALDVFPDGSKLTVAGSDFVVYLYDVATHKQLGVYGPGELHRIHDSLRSPEGHTNRVFAVKCHPTHPHLIYSGGWDNTVQLWDTRQQLPARHLYGPFMGGDSLDVDPAKNELLTGSYRKKDALEAWDDRNFSKIKTISDNEDECWLYAAQYARSAPLIAAAGGTKHELRILGRNSGLKVASFPDTNALYTLDLHPSSNMVITGGASRNLYVFDIDCSSALL